MTMRPIDEAREILNAAVTLCLSLEQAVRIDAGLGAVLDAAKDDLRISARRYITALKGVGS
jgi:hypothetical protein